MKSGWLLILAVCGSWVILAWFIFMMGVRVGQQLPCETDMECELRCGAEVQT